MILWPIVGIKTCPVFVESDDFNQMSAACLDCRGFILETDVCNDRDVGILRDALECPLDPVVWILCPAVLGSPPDQQIWMLPVWCHRGDFWIRVGLNPIRQCFHNYLTAADFTNAHLE